MRTLSIASFALASLIGCVEPSVDAASQQVIGGTRTPAGAHPTVGALYDEAQRSFFCTGTLIAPDAVLTAGHCLEGGGDVPSFTFDHDTRGQVTTVPGASIAVHPQFVLDRALSDGPTQYYDIAILHLAEPVLDVEPMVLASAAEAAGLTAGKMLTLVGYGQTVDGNPNSGGVLYQGNAPVIRTSPSELQISNPGGVQNCYGDSGGPAFTDLGAGLRTVGIVSRGATAAEACATGGVDTRVDYYLGWIRQQVPDICVGGETCAGGTGEPPAEEEPIGEDPTGEDPTGEDPTDPSDDGRPGEITGGCAAAGGGSAAPLGLLVVGLGLVLRRRRA